jgi:SAM-dependent methyltransferase
MTGGKASFFDRLRAHFEIPELRGVDLDDPETTALRRDIVMRDPAKRFAFEVWYKQLAEAVKDAPAGQKVELGAGGGFLDEFIPDLIRTDVVELPFLDAICFAEAMPYDDEELGAILMINVLHHIPDVRAFFREATRTLKPGGRVAMIEPTVTLLSTFVYRYLHHEPFDPRVEKWELPPSGRLSGGNDALPWVVHFRDLSFFQREFRLLEVIAREQFDCTVHILSGGVTTKGYVSARTLKFLQRFECLVSPLMPLVGLFQMVILEKRTPE